MIAETDGWPEPEEILLRSLAQGFVDWDSMRFNFALLRFAFARRVDDEQQ